MTKPAENLSIESNRNRRHEQRAPDSQLLFPVSMELSVGETHLVAEVLNYHHKGACLRLPTVPKGLLKQLQSNKVTMDFFVGNRKMRANVPFRIAWQSLDTDKTIGVEFLALSNEFISRLTRFSVHPEFAPQVSAADPMDPNRTIFFRVQNISESGLLLVSSLTNKHLLPGLVLKACEMSIPGQKSIQIDLFIANTRRSEVPGMFDIGVSVESNRDEYISLARRYITALSPSDDSEKIHSKNEPVVLTKSIKSALTYRAVTTESEYEQVLKLRYLAYSAHGKVKQGSTWKEQGEGLRNEGTLIAGFLGSKMICTAELRFKDGTIPFRLSKYVENVEKLAAISDKTVEINKLALHPKAQGSDLIVGIMQKIHGILVTKGGYDVLIAATDKLAPLYFRIGFKKSGLECPHPYLADQKLNVLILPKHLYLQARQINPVAWVAVYENTQRYLESVGVANKLQSRLSYRAKVKIGRFLNTLLLRKKGKARSTQSQKLEDSGHTYQFVDPKWTSQHIIAPIIKPYILEADEMVGAEKVDSILNRMGVPRSFFNRQANWVSVAFLDTFLDRFSQHGSIAELSRRAGQRSLQQDQIGMKYYLLKHLVTPEQSFRASEKILPTFNRTRTYRLVAVGPRSATVAIGRVPGYPLPKHRESCLNWQANFEAYFKVMSGTVGKVQKLSCCYDGAEACVYETRWTQSNRWLPSTLLGFALVAAAFGGYKASLVLIPALSIAQFLLAATALAGTVWAFRQTALRRKDALAFTKQFERAEQEGAEKYHELQQAKTTLDERYREARLLEETAKVIQAGNELSKILKASLDAICASFGFDRAFVMLADEQRQKLRTSAVACIDEGVDDIWRFQVDVSKPRENSIFVSSVFHTGNPVLIDDIETHYFQFNEASQKLIQRLGARGFIIVPIPSETANWGVLIADKNTPDKDVSRTDLILLQRMAQHLGLSLDKQSKLDNERNTRQLFQKYVPEAILSQVRQGGQNTIGGQLRKIACLFLDIRDFTQLSERFPPQATLDVLNQVFSLVQEQVLETEGWIDKFLGDGALVTWGAVNETSANAENAVRTALNISHALNALNAQLATQGYPAIHIGMGINAGPAIVGNVGAQSRMEYTSMGRTVNIASRLEQFAKQIEATLVVSSEVLNELPEPTRKLFSQIDNISLRGVDHPVSVGAILRTGHKKENE